MSVTVAEIAERIGAEIVGDAGLVISGLGSLGSAQRGDISHLSSPSYRHLLAGTGAGAVILSRLHRPTRLSMWIDAPAGLL